MPVYALCFLSAAAMASADGLSPVEGFAATADATAEFRLGGAATRTVQVPDKSEVQKLSQPRIRLSLPRVFREKGRHIRQTAIGGLSLIFGEGRGNSGDVYHLGTSLTRGQTTAGVKVTYQDQSETLESSELFVDYALTDQFRIGVSGMLNQDVTADSDPVPQVGLNAELTAPNGAFLQGGISGSGESDPIFGIAVGLRF
ncbi:MAG: hypothetical protein HKN18_17010 [Silicimonas sp.]|nr:hypothetical protein [Silicimonas sp.]